jgi:hypothetical protein
MFHVSPQIKARVQNKGIGPRIKERRQRVLLFCGTFA